MTRLVHTGLYTKKALDLIKILINSYIDWFYHYEPNTPVQCFSLGSGIMMRDVYKNIWPEMDHGEVMLSADSPDVGKMEKYIESTSDSKICIMLARFCRNILTCYGTDANKSNVKLRSSLKPGGSSATYNVKKSDVEILCKALEGKNISKLDTKQVKSIVGVAPDAIAYEMYSQYPVLREQIKKKYEVKIAEIQLSAIHQIAKLRVERDAEINDLDKVFKDTTSRKTDA